MDEQQYEAVRYAADGHAGEIVPSHPHLTDGAVLATGTLEECQDAIARHIEGCLSQSRWPGDDGDTEAYHESAEEGCGGWAIRRVAAE